MTIEEARKIIKKTESPYLKRDMQKFIQRQKKKNMIKQKKAAQQKNARDNPVLKSFSEQTP